MGFMDIFRKKKNDFNNYIMYNKKTINNSDKSSVIKIPSSQKDWSGFFPKINCSTICITGLLSIRLFVCKKAPRA